VKWSVDFPCARFSLDEESPGGVAETLRSWATAQGFKAVTTAVSHSCNWREDCSEAGCNLTVGVVFHY
jgi:hypothetical protein